MRLKDNLKTSCTFVGTLIGAGFASGQEVYLFFGESSWYVPLFAGIMTGVFAFIFAEIGRRSKKNGLFESFFPNTHKIWDFAIGSTNFFVLAAMAAGAELAVYSSLGVLGGGVITLLIAFGVCKSGSEKVKLANFIIVPAIVAMIYIILYVMKPRISENGSSELWPAITYPAMNILTSGIVLAKLSDGFILKDSLAVSGISALIITMLLMPVFFIVKQMGDMPMPLLEACKQMKMGGLGSAIVYAAIVSTCIGTMSAFGELSDIKLGTITVGASIASLFGFELIVETVYPVMGALGIVLTICILTCKLAGKIKNKIVEKRKRPTSCFGVEINSLR